MPDVARDEVSAGLHGRLRMMIAAAEVDDPALPLLRDQLLAQFGVTPDATGALTVLDRVYAGRLLRRQVPPIISACCVSWYGHWRRSNGGPSSRVAEALRPLVETWISEPSQRSDCDAKIITLAQELAGTDLIAIEDAAA